MNQIQALKNVIVTGTQYEHTRSLTLSTVWGDRIVFLAYGFLRGTPYRVMEPTSRPFFEVYGHDAKSLIPNLVALLAHHGAEVTEEAILAWMDVPETETRRVKRQEAMTKAQERRTAHRITLMGVLASKGYAVKQRVAA